MAFKIDLRTVLFAIVAVSCSGEPTNAQLLITSVFDGPLPGGTPKGVELYAAENIDDLSLFALGSANNGGGTDGEEFFFPADTVSAGEFIYVASEDAEFANFFGFAPDYLSGAVIINGDDAIEVFFNNGVIDVFGEIDVDGTDQPWEFTDGWAYRENSAAASGSQFQIDDWSFSGVDAFDGAATNELAPLSVPLGSYEPATSPLPNPHLRAGDANQDYQFDQFDLIKVQVAAKYLTTQAATWGEGDWDGAPGGSAGDPPKGNGFFDQFDIIASLSEAIYLTGPYAAKTSAGEPEAGTVTLGYDANTGQLWAVAPPDSSLTSVNITSNSQGFLTTRQDSERQRMYADGVFDVFDRGNIFKATFGGELGELEFGPVMRTKLSREFVETDLQLVGSFSSGGVTDQFQLLYVPVPEPSSLFMIYVAAMGMLVRRHRNRSS